MKVIKCWLIFLAVMFSILLAPGLRCHVNAMPEDASGASGDKTLSPYFFVKSNDPALDQLPLKETSASVNISGVIADIVVTQVYKNEGKFPLEAIYIFPASTRAAVYGMKMTIGKRVVEAKIKKRDEARRDYEQARDQGKGASLLEQQRPNVFQMNVANIMPGEEIRVELKYTELLVPIDRVYEFVYPTVVGPRYSNAKGAFAPASEKWVQNPYLREGEKPHYSFHISADITAGMPIREITSTSHKVNIAYDSTSTAKVSLDRTEKNGGNRDFILRYRLAGDKVESGLLLFEGVKENYFLCMVQPPNKVSGAQIPAREYIFIVDVSGSMHGFPLNISKELLKNLIGNLRPTDKFNVMLFSGGSTVMSEASLPATSENISRAIQVIDHQQGGGGTELLPALKRALALKRSEGVSRSVVIVTDGYVSVEEEAFDLIRNNLGDANMFAFGIGSSVNRHLIEGMARVGMGEPFVITKPDEARQQAERFSAMIQSPVLTGIKATYRGFAAYDVEPVSIPDVLADRPVLVFGKWRGKARGKIVLNGMTGKGEYAQIVDVSATEPKKANEAIRYLWARHRIAILSGYNALRPDDRRIKEVTELGLAYNLLTAYTSFVAIDSEVRNKDGKTQTVNQPLPLPQGVSDYAVGSGVSPMKTMAVAPAPAAERGNGSIRYDQVWKLKEEEKSRETSRERNAGTIKINDITVSGGLTKKTVRAVIEAEKEGFAACFSGDGTGGKITLHFAISPDGTVKDASVIPGTMKDRKTVECLIDSIRKMFFPKVADGRETLVKLVLTRSHM